MTTATATKPRAKGSAGNVSRHETEKTTKETRQVDPIEKAWNGIAPLLVGVQDQFKHIGDILFEVEPKIGYGGVLTLVRRAAQISKAPQAMFIVWYRIAKGELPESLIQTAIQISTLANMDVEFAAKLAAKEPLTVTSNGQGRPTLMTKTAFELNAEEAAEYIKPAGVVPISKTKSPPPYHSVIFDDIFVEDEFIVLVHEGMRLRGMVSIDLLEGVMVDAGSKT